MTAAVLSEGSCGGQQRPEDSEQDKDPDDHEADNGPAGEQRPHGRPPPAVRRLAAASGGTITSRTTTGPWVEHYVNKVG